MEITIAETDTTPGITIEEFDGPEYGAVVTYYAHGHAQEEYYYDTFEAACDFVAHDTFAADVQCEIGTHHTEAFPTDAEAFAAAFHTA